MKTSFGIARRAAAGALRQGRHLLWAFLLGVGLIGQAMAEPPLEKIEIRYQGWAGQVTFPGLAEDLARVIAWAQATPPEEMRARFERIIASRKRNEDASPIKYWKSTGVATKGGVIGDAEVQVWIDWLVKDGLLKPEQLKPSDIYTNEFNFYRAGKTADAQ